MELLISKNPIIHQLLRRKYPNIKIEPEVSLTNCDVIFFDIDLDIKIVKHLDSKVIAVAQEYNYYRSMRLLKSGFHSIVYVNSFLELSHESESFPFGLNIELRNIGLITQVSKSGVSIESGMGNMDKPVFGFSQLNDVGFDNVEKNNQGFKLTHRSDISSLNSARFNRIIKKMDSYSKNYDVVYITNNKYNLDGTIIKKGNFMNKLLDFCPSNIVYEITPEMSDVLVKNIRWKLSSEFPMSNIVMTSNLKGAKLVLKDKFNFSEISKQYVFQKVTDRIIAYSNSEIRISTINHYEMNTLFFHHDLRGFFRVSGYKYINGRNIYTMDIVDLDTTCISNIAKYLNKQSTKAISIRK